LRDAFLYVTDVISPSEDALEADDEETASAAAADDGSPVALSVLSDGTIEAETAHDGPATPDEMPGGSDEAADAAPGAPSDQDDATRAQTRQPRGPDRTPPRARVGGLLNDGQEGVLQVV